MLKIELDDGKYTYIRHDDGRQEALRYGEPWRDLVGDNLIGALASEIESLSEQVKDPSQPTPAQLVMKQCGDDFWGECAQHRKEDWQYEAKNGDTVLGYWDWVVHQAEADGAGLVDLVGTAGAAG